ncbi:hypothetical protein TRIUR3_19221 [Triticum urartu]|uniref:Uncharacterized protein n=1 Tax=Triticum urartu TaxID=4572 RepID=M8A4R3_TRIUA|nr:hypothetical protein TRIUR3_19221 [Triticum urartu]
MSCPHPHPSGEHERFMCERELARVVEYNLLLTCFSFMAFLQLRDFRKVSILPSEKSIKFILNFTFREDGICFLQTDMPMHEELV